MYRLSRYLAILTGLGFMFDIESRGPAYALAGSPPWLPDYDITEKAISSLLLILLFILILSRC